MFRKAALLAVACCAVAALAVPITAQAMVWAPIEVEGKSQPIGLEPVPFELEGQLTETAELKQIICTYHVEGNVWNKKISGRLRAEAEVTNVVVDTPCPIQLKGSGTTICEVTKASFAKEAGVEQILLGEVPVKEVLETLWSNYDTGISTGKEITIGSHKTIYNRPAEIWGFSREYSQGCPLASAAMSGVMAGGVWSNLDATHATGRISFSNDPGMYYGPSVASQISGDLNVVSPPDLFLYNPYF